MHDTEDPHGIGFRLFVFPAITVSARQKLHRRYSFEDAGRLVSRCLGFTSAHHPCQYRGHSASLCTILTEDSALPSGALYFSGTLFYQPRKNLRKFYFTGEIEAPP